MDHAMPSQRHDEQSNKKRPKIKGCYQCSQRRINCDRGKPACQKCCAKGLSCSGLGVRYRFSNGLASRGKLVGKTVPDQLSYKKTSLVYRPNVPRHCGEEKVCDAVERPPAAPLELSGRKVVLGTDCESQPSCRVPASLDHVDGKTRWYLQYFAEHVIPIVSVIDTGFNGYRNLLLPAADADSLVRKAVMVVANQHLTSQIGTSTHTELACHASVLHELIERSKHTPPEKDEAAMTALFLLNIREIFSERDEFKLVYGPLRTLVNRACFRLPHICSGLGQFIKIQILRLCLFGEALFDEKQGIEFLSVRREECLGFLQFCHAKNPGHKELISCLLEMFELACDIYVQRALRDPEPRKTVAQVEQFRLLTVRVDTYDGTVGRHILAWSYFIIAAESSTPEHREFFLTRLQWLHTLTKCGNIRKAVDQLHEIWSVQSITRWTSLLGGPSQALIM